MHKIKDRLWLLFWGILAGAVFVGCILGFGSLVNKINAQGSAGISLIDLKIGLFAVICVVLWVLFKIALVFNNKITHKQAAKVFSPELLNFIYKAPLAKAVVEQREDKMANLRFLPEDTRIQAINAPIHNGITPLHIAAALGRTKFCAKLLALGADLQTQDAGGKTPADYAALFNRQETFQFLQSYYNKNQNTAHM